MTKYLFTFPSGPMDHIPAEEMPDVAKAAHACCREIVDAGVYVVAGGLVNQPATVVATDGTISRGPTPDLVSGLTIVDVPNLDEALAWAARIAAACRCPQEVREIMPDPELDAMLEAAAD